MKLMKRMRGTAAWLGVLGAVAAASCREESSPEAGTSSASQGTPTEALPGSAVPAASAPATLPGTQPAPLDVEPLLLKGQELLHGLPLLAETYANTIDLEMMEPDGQLQGVAELSLRARPAPDRLLYDYRYAVTLKIADDSALVITNVGTVDSRFCPLEIRREEARVRPDGKTIDAASTTTIGADKVTIRVVHAGQETSQEVDRPPGPFVIGASFILQLAEVPGGGPFALRVFNPSAGTVVPQVFTPTRRPDGTLHIDVQNEGQGPGGHYLLAKDRSLLSFQEVAMPFLMKRTTKEKVQEYTESLQPGRAAAASRPTSSPAPRSRSQPAEAPRATSVAH